MTVTYQPPLTRSYAQVGESLTHEVIETGPAYIRSARSTRWHRVRSAYRALRERPVGPDFDQLEVLLVEHYQHWCGSTTSHWPTPRAGRPDVARPLLVDTVPAGEPSCGTCEGRAIGADAARPEWLFTPSTLERPARCPGSRTMLVVEDQGRWNRATCLVCGDVVKLRAGGPFYASNLGAAAHPPGPGLVPGCPFHAWRDLVRAVNSDGHPVAACRCHTQERDHDR